MDSDFGRIVDALPGLVWTALPDGQADFLNQRWCEYTGLSMEQAIRDGWQVAVHSDDVARLLDYWLSLLAGGQPGEVEARLRRHDGAYRWFAFRFAPVTDSGGRVVKWCGINTDIDDLKNEQSARLIVNGIPGLVAVFTPEGELEQVNDQVLAFYGKSHEELKNWASIALIHPDDQPRSLEAFAKGLRSGALFEIENRSRRADGSYRWLQSRVLPLKDADGRIMRWFNLLIDIDEGKRAQEALAASERNLKLIIDATPAVIWSARPNGATDYVNKHFIDFVGVSGKELQDNWTKVVHPDDYPELNAYWDGLIASGESGAFEARLRRHDGAYRWFLFQASPVRDESGAIVKWYGVNTDIEDRKRAEEALRASERKLRLAIDATPSMLWSADAHGIMDGVNRTFIDYVGEPLDEGDRAGWAVKFVHPEDRRALFGTWAEMNKLGLSATGEARLKRHDGQYRWFQFRGNPVRDEAGAIVKWYCVNFDIEDRKRAEDAVLASQRDLEMAIDTTPAMIWTTDAVGATETVNRPYLDYVGLPLDELLGWGWTRVIHPDDQARLTAEWGEIMALGEAGHAEARLCRYDGSYRWFLLRANPQRDADGKIRKWYGVNIDIEDRKRAEEAVAASESNLRETIDTIPTFAWCNRTDGSNEFLSKRWHDYTGMTPADANGWGWQAALHPDDLAMLLDIWRDMLATGKPGTLEARLRRHDGVYRWFLFRCDPLRDESGKVIKWYGTNTDIEDLKVAEAERKRAYSYLTEAQRLSLTGSFTWDVQADEHNWSEEIYRIFGFEPGTKVTMAMIQGAIYPEDMGAVEAVIGGAIDGKEFDAVFRIVTAGGAIKHAHVVAHPIERGADRPVFIGAIQDVSETKVAEEALRQANAHLARAQRLSRTGSSTWDLTSGEHVWTDELHRIFEFELGSTVTVERVAACVHKDDVATFRAGAAHLASGGSSIDFGFRITTPSGALKHLHVLAHRDDDRPDRPTIVGAFQDVTETKAAEDALRRSEAFLVQGEAVSETGSFLWHPESREVIRWSDQLYRIYEFDLGTPVTIGRISSRMHPEDRHLAADMAAHARDGRPSEYEYRLLMPDGRVKHLRFVAHPTRDEEGKPAYMGTLQDVTARRMSEQALGKVRSELAHVARVTSLNALTASIAHEVNQPLAGIITNAGTCLRMLAADPPNVDGARETARRTIRDGNRASEVITRLRALFAKGEASLEAMDLNEAAREVIALSVNELQRGRVILRQEFADDLPEVAGDRVQLQQVVLNLILNAADAMSDIDDRQRELVIRTELDEDDHVRLDVQDSGAGIDPQNAAKLFDAFYTTKSNGMGIGLSVSRSIIERHQGRLWGRGNAGPGATFSFAIPRGGEESREVARQP